MGADDLMKDNGSGLAVPEANVTRRLKEKTTHFEDNLEIKGPRPWLDIRAFQEKDDGTDSTQAIMRAIDFLPPDGGVIFFPAGTYVIEDHADGILIANQNVVFRGSGMRQTTLKAAGKTLRIFQSSSPCQNITIEDMALDGGNVVISSIVFYGSQIQGVRISRCHFFNFDATFGIIGSDTANCVVEDCLFESLHPPGGTGIQFEQGIENLLIDRCVFRYCRNGLIIAAGGNGTPSDETLASGITVRNCLFEGGWWILPVRSMPSGSVYTGSAIFTDNLLTDPTASFPPIGLETTIRLMHQRAAGTTTKAGQTYFQDSNTIPQFDQIGIVQGDIVRTDGAQKKFAVITGVGPGTIVRVEEWLDDTTRQASPPPVSGTIYRIFHVLLGRCTTANTATMITVERWHDLEGATISGAILTSLDTPLQPLRYEVLPDHPGYLLHAEYDARDIRVLNNVFRRGWADQCSVYGDRALIAGNDIRDGQDTGITSNGQKGGEGGHTLITNNVIRHHGAMGIFSTGEGSIISNNVLSRNTWVNFINVFWLADIVVGGDHSLVIGNQCDGEDKPLARYGIVLGGTANATVVDNKCRRHTVACGGAGIHCYSNGSDGPSGMRIWNNEVSTEAIGLKHTDVPDGGDYQIVGQADPNTAVSNFTTVGSPTKPDAHDKPGILAAPGSTYRRTSGEPPFFYVKESMANDPTGWVPK